MSIFPYRITTYAKRRTYRLRAVGACMLPGRFTYHAVWQRHMRILQLQTHQGENMLTVEYPCHSSFQAHLRKWTAGVQFLPALFYPTVCYAHFFTFPYSTATYAKRATSRLKAIEASLLPLRFTYLTVWQYYTRIFRLQTHQGENVETSRCSKLSAENVNDWGNAM